MLTNRIRGLSAAVAAHNEVQKMRLNEARKAKCPKWLSRLSLNHDPRRWRHGGNAKRPKFAIIEQAVLPQLLSHSDDAIRLYVTAAQFANGKTGIATFGQRRLFRELFFAPYHTNFINGAVRVALSKKQRRTRDGQVDRFLKRVQIAIEELVAADLLRCDIHEGGPQRIISLTFLRQNGDARNIRQLRKRNAFFKVLDEWVVTGQFAMYRGHMGRTFKQLSGRELRIFLLALRDHDDLRFGGVDPSKVFLQDGIVTCGSSGWPMELFCSAVECERAFAALVARSNFKVHEIIASCHDGHLIRFGSHQNSPDEIAILGFRPKYRG